jgi:hypothetical protein
MKVTIDDAQPSAALSSMAMGSATDYFDVKSGKRTFKVFNESGETIFDKGLEINSFERVTVVFAGFYSSVDLENTFGNFNVEEGEIYVSSKPSQDSLNIYLVHASAPVDTNDSKTYSVNAEYTPTGSQEAKDTTYTSSLTYANVYGIGNAAPGNYTFSFIAGTDTTQFTADYSANLRYYLFLYGDPINVQFFNNEVVPPPIRSRDE